MPSPMLSLSARMPTSTSPASPRGRRVPVAEEKQQLLADLQDLVCDAQYTQKLDGEHRGRRLAVTLNAARSVLPSLCLPLRLSPHNTCRVNPANICVYLI